jgi:hypothetical protein
MQIRRPATPVRRHTSAESIVERITAALDLRAALVAAKV